MRAVTGSIVSSKTASLSHAARTLRQFIESDAAAKPETAAYLRRAAAAFDDLVEFYHEIKHGKDENAGIEEIEEEKKEKKKKKKKKRNEEDLAGLEREQDGGDGGLESEIGDGDLENEKKKKKKKRKRENVDESYATDSNKEKIDGGERVEKETNLEGEVGNLGDGELVNGEVDSGRKKKKRKKSEKEKEIQR